MGLLGWCGAAEDLPGGAQGEKGAEDLGKAESFIEDDPGSGRDEDGEKTLVRVDEAKEELLGAWGPRPTDAQQMVVDRKADPNPMPYNEFQILLQKWYLKDKGRQTQDELREVLAGVV